MSWVTHIPFKEQGMTEDMVVLLEDLAEESDYWRSASDFVYQVQGRDHSSLSDGQKDWIRDIIATLAVELNRKVARELYGSGPGVPGMKEFLAALKGIR